MENLPNKIYLNLGDLSEEEFNDTDFNDLSEITWSEDDVQGRNVEYVRKDAFIEKACEWLSNVSIEDMTYKYSNFDTSEGWYKFIEEFRKAMKGE